jgi:hypothetical protein
MHVFQIFLSSGCNFCIFYIKFHVLFRINFMYYDGTNIRQKKVLIGQQEVKLVTTVASDKLSTIDKFQVCLDVILRC